MINSNILITGGTGFFGKSILDYLDQFNLKNNVTILSRNRVQFKSYKNIIVNQIIGDIRTFKLSNNYNYIIHAATPAIVNITDQQMHSIIIDGMNNLLRQVKNNNYGTKILFTSSGAVYGDYNRHVSENDKCNPDTEYGRSKLQAEKILLDSGMNCNIARCFAFSGKYLKQDIHFAIGNFIKNAKENNDIVIKSDGSSIRSYLDQKDLSQYILKILFYGHDKEIYNVGSCNPISIKDLAYLIRDMFNKNINVKILGQTQFSNSKAFYVPNVSKIKNQLCCKQTVSLEESLCQMYNI